MWRSSEFHQVGTRKGMQRERDSQKYRLTPRHGRCHLRCVAGSEMGSGPSDSGVKWGTPTKVASATSWGSACLVGPGAPIRGKPPYLLDQSSLVALCSEPVKQGSHVGGLEELMALSAGGALQRVLGWEEGRGDAGWSSMGQVTGRPFLCTEMPFLIGGDQE